MSCIVLSIEMSRDAQNCRHLYVGAGQEDKNSILTDFGGIVKRLKTLSPD
jgi:hypothetical protein